MKRYHLKKSSSKFSIKNPKTLDYYDSNPYIEGSLAHNLASDFTINEKYEQEMLEDIKTRNKYASIDQRNHKMPRLVNTQSQSKLTLSKNNIHSRKQS